MDLATSAKICEVLICKVWRFKTYIYQGLCFFFVETFQAAYMFESFVKGEIEIMEGEKKLTKCENYGQLKLN